ncbi:MAG: ABC transporter permease, partial [Polyangiaceae bacterium]
MRLGDYIEEIVWSFQKQRLRTVLTATGIAIGAFAIALMVGLGQGLQSYIEAQIRAFGNPRVVVVMPERTAKAGERFMDILEQFGKPATRLDKQDIAEKNTMRGGLWITPAQVALLRAIPGVQSVSPFTMLETDGLALVSPTGTAGAEAEVVLAPQYAESFGLSRDALLGRLVVLRVPKLSTVTRSFLFRDPTKYKPEHRDFRARVVGLSERSPMSRVVYVSIPLGREMARYQAQNPDILSDEKIGFQAHVRIKDDADPERVKAQIRKLGLSARSMEDQLQA